MKAIEVETISGRIIAEFDEDASAMAPSKTARQKKGKRAAKKSTPHRKAKAQRRKVDSAE